MQAPPHSPIHQPACYRAPRNDHPPQVPRLAPMLLCGHGLVIASLTSRKGAAARNMIDRPLRRGGPEWGQSRAGAPNAPGGQRNETRGLSFMSPLRVKSGTGCWAPEPVRIPPLASYGDTRVKISCNDCIKRQVSGFDCRYSVSKDASK
jgi:hypothetical protein